MSEFSLIARHFSRHQATNDIAISVGDDCAVVDVPVGQQLVICTDTMVANRHYPSDTPAHAIGHKAVAVNLSDLSAMGATPHSITLALSLPSYDEAWVADFADGLYQICDRYGVKLIGGDTTYAPTTTISVTAVGYIPKHQSITRRGAMVGDVICVSGHIGSASFALSQILQNQPSQLRDKLDYPEPQVALGQALRGYAHSMIDISDGLGQDLGHILAASGVGARLDLDKIPCHTLLEHLPFAQKYQHIINGGDDYQLCFTMNKEKFDQFQANFPHFSIHAIGEIVADGGVQLFEHGQAVAFDIKGFEHF